MQVVFGRILEVAYELNGANGSWDPTKVVEGKTIEAPTFNPKRPGVKFVGWYTDSALTNKFDFDTPIMDNMTLYAGYSDTVSGTVSGGGSTSVTTPPTNTQKEKEYKTCGAAMGVSVVFPAIIGFAVTGLIIKKAKKED